MLEQYKLVVIGAGPGGYVAAIRAAQLGMKTAIVEREYFGGVCLNWGCIPSKTLLYATELKRRIEESARIGITADKVEINLDKLRKHKDATVKRLTGGVKMLLEKSFFMMKHRRRKGRQCQLIQIAVKICCPGFLRGIGNLNYLCLIRVTCAMAEDCSRLISQSFSQDSKRTGQPILKN